MCINDDTSLQEIFSIYYQVQSQVPVIELYVEFDQLPNTVEQHDHDFDWKSYNGDSEEEYEGNYDFVEPNADEEQEDCTIESDVEDVANALASEHPFEEPSFMRALDLDAMNAPEFSEFANADPPMVEDGEFVIGMEFNSREAVIKAVKDYTIHRGVDYRVFESEPTTFYAKCVQYGQSCDWLIKDHSKLDSDTIAEAIKPLVEADPSIKVRSVIADVQSLFNYTISYRKAWLAKQKVVEKIFGGWEASYKALPTWFEAMVKKEPSTAIEYETLPCYRGNELAQDVRVLNRVFWSFYPFSQDGNNNIVPIAFALVEGKTLDAWFFFLRHLQTHVVTKDGVGLISDRHESIRSAVSRCEVAWEPPRAIHIFCIRHIASNFLRKFKAPFMQKIVVNIGYSRTVDEYEIRYQRLHSRGEAYTRWLDQILRQQHSLAYDGGHRWGHMMTNLVECINGVLKGAHNLSVTAFVKAIFYRLNEFFTRKRDDTETRVRAGHLFSETMTEKIQQNLIMAGNIMVSCFDRQNEVFEVWEIHSGVEYAVDLRCRHCDCGYFQVSTV
ncbi:uncharacterized protein LOC107632694 [Arachis ipaensis]|uniref:uncharacterized protein LOC107632694 n=1 Tax=Arachis ipaensis TaxID=130454 RepID=UPI0007AFDFCE|nr:uncharacterized protein LOC107632694 [Arachis ipaensis]XP_025637436.1 uncharacterized protein LOC112732843 [Arachis hypogaea]